MTMLYPGCPVCHALDEMDGKPFAETMRLLGKAMRLTCRCAAAHHVVLAQHPHTVAGCRGFRREEQ